MQVVGASADSARANQRWAEKHGLGMPLISDPGGTEVVAAFGVARPPAGTAQRTTWLIDPDGTIRKVYPKVAAKGHAAKVLADAREIWA